MSLFNKYDQSRDLMRVLFSAANTVKFNLNMLVDIHQEYDLNLISKIYPLHAPLEILNGQNILNIAQKNSLELQKLLDHLNKRETNDCSSLTVIQSIIKTDKSSRGALFER